jgi:hypothetical protein
MRIPKESLEDFLNTTIRKRPDPPAVKQIRLTGEVEVIKPLARWNGPAARVADSSGERSFIGRMSWFHRSMAAAGAAAVIAFIVLSGISIGIFGPPVEPVEVASINEPLPVVADRDEPSIVDSLSVDDLPGLFEEPSTDRVFRRARSSNRRTTPVAFRRRRALPPPQFVVSQFVPTTLIIYVENGEIRTRIEPQTVGIRRPLSLPN